MNDTVALQSPEVEGDFTNEEVATMVALSEQIPLLWTAHKQSKLEAKRTKQELVRVRHELSAHLHQVKALLARPGREGLWSSFLREARIPRATADRYVAAYEVGLQNGNGNCPTKAIQEDMPVQVHRLIQRILPQLLKTLTTKQSVFLFLSLVLDRLPEADYNIEGWYLEVFCPREEHAPARHGEVQ